MMKYLIIWSLVILISFQTVLCAQGLDKEKLLQLKPLCSERINKQSSDYKNNRLLAVGTFLLIGVSLLPTNFEGPIDNNKLGIFSVGLISIIGGALTLFSTGDPVIQNINFWDLGLEEGDREIAAYAIMNNNAAQIRNDRKMAGRFMIASGLGAILLASIAASATQDYKNQVYLGAVINLYLGWGAFNNPDGSEIEMNEIDKELGLSI